MRQARRYRPSITEVSSASAYELIGSVLAPSSLAGLNLESLMQAKGVPTTHAQAVMGHASGTITFDTYGSGVPVETIAELLKELFPVSSK